jgi:hypothetical protein
MYWGEGVESGCIGEENTCPCQDGKVIALWISKN